MADGLYTCPPRVRIVRPSHQPATSQRPAGGWSALAHASRPCRLAHGVGAPRARLSECPERLADLLVIALAPHGRAVHGCATTSRPEVANRWARTCMAQF